MSGRYQVEVQIGKQEDGLWRVEVPGLHGCWVDAPTLAQALAEIQEGAAMVLDEYEERGWDLPSSVAPLGQQPGTALLPVLINEHLFARAQSRAPRVKPGER